MNVYLSFSLFSLMILLYWVITELFTIFFRFTGLPDEKARFQVISLLTGCGFTTRESEMILSSRSRRRLARITMLFGYVFNITIVSAFVNLFFSLKVAQVGTTLYGVLIPVGALAIIFAFIRIPLVHAWGERILSALADRIIRSEGGNTVMPIDYIGTDSIAQVTINYIPKEYQNMSLADTGLRNHTGILVMLVESPGQKPVAAGPSTVFRIGDKVTVFGDYAAICRCFQAHERFTDD